MPLKRPFIRTGRDINLPPRSSLAAGYWGGNPKDIMMSDQKIEQIRANNEAFLKMSPVADIWVKPRKNLDSLPVCSCVKVTNQSADIRCMKCFGVKKIPGYVKWGYNTCFFSAVGNGLADSSDTGQNLPSSIAKDTTTTRQVLILAPGVIASEFQTPDFAVDNPYSEFWELEARVYNQAPGNYYKVEWSLDQGVTWLSSDFGSLRLARGTIRFQITLGRTNAQTKSPQFEILRFRHPIQDVPYIRMARNMGRRKKKREEMGLTEDESGLQFWTSILEGNNEGRAQINGQTVFDSIWFHSHFITLMREGVFAGDRYWTVDNQVSEYAGIATTQWWTPRKIQSEESFASLF